MRGQWYAGGRGRGILSTGNKSNTPSDSRSLSSGNRDGSCLEGGGGSRGGCLQFFLQ